MRIRADKLLGDNEYGADHPFYYASEALRWADEAEGVYARALLYAGAEPEIEYTDYDDEYGYRETYATAESQERHLLWCTQVMYVLMEQFKHHWWYRWVTGELRGDPKYRRKAHDVWDTVRKEEMRRFYAWLCKERDEPWTDRI